MKQSINIGKREEDTMSKLKDNFLHIKDIQVRTYITAWQWDKIKKHSERFKMPITRLFMIMVDKELENEKPFQYDVTLPEPTDDSQYQEEGNILLNYMKTLRIGKGLDQLICMRHDLGISREAILETISNCLDLGIIEQFKPPYKKGRILPDDYFYYRVADQKGHETTRKRKNRMNDYQKLQHLSKKLGIELKE